MQAYANGVLQTGSAWFTGSPSSIQSASEKLFLCRHGDTGSGSGNTVIHIAILANTIWTGNEVKALSENPWQIFQPRPARFILIPGSSGVAIPSLSSPFFTNRVPSVTLTY
jgi:hypothetical protein